MLSMLTMCATYKSPSCCFPFLTSCLPPSKKWQKGKGGMLTPKWSRQSCASIFIHAEHTLSSRNREGDECCIYLSFTSWYANIMRSALQITKVCVNTDSEPCFQMQLAHREHKYRLWGFFFPLERILSDNSGLCFPLRQRKENYIIPSA